MSQDVERGDSEVSNSLQYGEVTRMLLRWSGGDPKAQEELMAAVYSELRQLASAYLRRESARDMQATTLVQDAYLRLIYQRQVRWQNRAHFFGIAAQQMRRVLVDRAREHLAQKRGAGVNKLSLDEALTLSDDQGPIQRRRLIADGARKWCSRTVRPRTCFSTPKDGSGSPISASPRPSRKSTPWRWDLSSLP